MEHCIHEENRLESCLNEEIAGHIISHIASLKTLIMAIEKDIQHIIKGDATLYNRAKLTQKVCGIGHRQLRYALPFFRRWAGCLVGK